MLIDSHCHLENNNNIKELIERAKQVGVEYILDVGSGLNNMLEHLQICSRFDGVYTAAGAHPHEANEYKDITADDIIKAADNEKVIAIGEAGLDYFYDFAPKEAQIELFEKNIKASQITGKPLIIHNRESDDDMINIVKKAYDKKEFKAIVHCYSSTWRLAEEALKMGFYISASGIITFNNSEEIRQNFAKIPTDRLLIETDSPYLAPVPHRGKINEPANVVFTAQKLAEIKNISFFRIDNFNFTFTFRNKNGDCL